MELYINSTWTEHYENVYVAEAIAYSEKGNHATIYATGVTADEANDKLRGALCELELIPEEIALVRQRRLPNLVCGQFA